LYGAATQAELEDRTLQPEETSERDSERDSEREREREREPSEAESRKRGPYQIEGKRTHLAKLRRREGVSQQDLADKLGVHRSMISWWETGVHPLSYERSLEIINALGLGGKGIHNNYRMVAGDLFCRHNTDFIRMYLDNNAHIPTRAGIMLLQRMNRVRRYRETYGREANAMFKRTYRELLDRTFQKDE
jgi:transcriptional regulator with XRE-family HTH domain